MVTKTLQLNDEAYLQFNIGEKAPGWTDVFLFSNGEKRLLGAEVYKDLETKLKTVLSTYRERPKAGVKDGLPLVFVFTLWEVHSTVYLAYKDNDSWFFFQDADAKMFAKILLSNKIFKLVESL
jgi:hypothetical protein